MGLVLKAQTSMKETYPTLILSYILKYLTSQGFKRKTFYTSAHGSHAIVEDPDGINYDILINPITKQEGPTK